MQVLCQTLGKSGCYFFCLLKIAGFVGNPLTLARECIKNGWMRSDAFVLDPDRILAAAGSKLHIMSERSAHAGKVVIAHTPEFGGHFVVVDDEDKVLYDPINRLTGTSPVIDSWRNFV